jgi:hypothetical protein
MVANATPTMVTHSTAIANEFDTNLVEGILIWLLYGLDDEDVARMGGPLETSWGWWMFNSEQPEEDILFLDLGCWLGPVSQRAFEATGWQLL